MFPIFPFMGKKQNGGSAIAKKFQKTDEEIQFAANQQERVSSCKLLSRSLKTGEELDQSSSENNPSQIQYRRVK